MSYDLYLMRTSVAGSDVRVAMERFEEIEALEPSPDEQLALRGLAADLAAANPGVDLTEAEQRFVLQLGYGVEAPVVIDIAGLDNIQMMWSYARPEADDALDEVRRYLPVFERHGYAAVDPQIERILDLDRDAGEIATTHRTGHRMLLKAVEEHARETGPAKPRWRRLLGR